MNYEEFKTKLDEHSLSLKDFAELTNISYSGVNKWKYSEIPGWVDSWFKLYDENKKISFIKNDILEFAKRLELK